MPQLTRRPQLLILAILVATAGLAVSLVSMPVDAIPLPDPGCGDTIIICNSWVKDGCCANDPVWQNWTRRCWSCPQNCTPCYYWWDETKCEGMC